MKFISLIQINLRDANLKQWNSMWAKSTSQQILLNIGQYCFVNLFQPKKTTKDYYAIIVHYFVIEF